MSHPCIPYTGYLKVYLLYIVLHCFVVYILYFISYCMPLFDILFSYVAYNSGVLLCDFCKLLTLLDIDSQLQGIF